MSTCKSYTGLEQHDTQTYLETQTSYGNARLSMHSNELIQAMMESTDTEGTFLIERCFNILFQENEPCYVMHLL